MTTNVELRLFRGGILMKTMNPDAPVGSEWSFTDGATARADVCQRLLADGLLRPMGDGLFPETSQLYSLKPYVGTLDEFITERFGAGWFVCNRRTPKLKAEHQTLILQSEYAEAEREWRARSGSEVSRAA